MSLEPQDEQEIRELARRADSLIDRRRMLGRAGRVLALPLLISLTVTRDAMGMAGSGGGGSSDPDGYGDHYGMKKMMMMHYGGY